MTFPTWHWINRILPFLRLATGALDDEEPHTGLAAIKESPFYSFKTWRIRNIFCYSYSEIFHQPSGGQFWTVELPYSLFWGDLNARAIRHSGAARLGALVCRLESVFWPLLFRQAGDLDAILDSGKQTKKFYQHFRWTWLRVKSKYRSSLRHKPRVKQIQVDWTCEV